MKKLYLLFVLCLCAVAAFSQTLFTYGGRQVDKEEFLRAYNKNKTPVADKEKALREYLDLYIRFKLKVAVAKEMMLDTLPQLQYDAQSFSTQIQDGYLSNENAMNDLIAEAFSRSQKDLHVLHFFSAVSNAAKPEDTSKAYKAITSLYNSLAAGNTDYEKQIALAGGENIKQSDFGFITAFSLPYEYENVVYSLNKAQVSKPYRSKNGWHVFKVIDERKAVGKWKIAQILIAMPPDQPEINKPLLQKKADSVYRLLQNGADFGKLVPLVSDDKQTFGNNGELPEFGSGKYQPSFENEILKLGRDGEISKPFLTEYGYHIVKRLSHIPVSADKEDPAFQFDLKQKVQQDSRANIARELFVKEIQKQINFKKTGAVADAELYRYADSIIANPAIETSNQPISNKTIFSFGKSKITGKDWLDFVRSYKGNAELYQNENNTALVEKFISSSSLDYYKKNLEEYNSDFRYQMQEFRDGNVLFEIMERNVWGSAAADTAALAKHYNANRNKYLWAASADIILFNCFSKTIADGVRESLKGGKDWKKIVEEADNRIQADSGRFELSQIPIVVDMKLPPGSLTETTVNAQDGSAGFAKIIRHYVDGMQRSFDEARGLVINDYQNILEEKWISDLKKKYPVKINELVFQSLLK